MKTPSTTTNVVTGIFATIFSIIFVISFILTSIVWGITTLITPEGLTEFFTSDNLINFVLESPDVDTMIQESGIPAEAMAELLDSDFADELLSSFAEGMSSEILGTESKTTYDEEHFKNICIENKDDIMAFLEMFPEAEGLSEEDMNEVFNNFVEDVPAQLANGISEASDSLAESDDVDYIMLYQFVVKQLPIILAISTFVILIICCLLRIKFTYGMMWTGVTSVVAGVITFCMSLSLGSSATVIAELAEAPYITPVFTAMSEKMTISSLIPLVIGIALIVTKVLITKAKNNKEETNEGCIRD